MLMQVRFPAGSELPPDLRSQGEQSALGATEPVVLDRLGRFVLFAVQSAVAWIVEYLLKIASRVAIYFAGAVMRAEDRNALEFRALTAAALKDLTGADVGSDRKAIGRALLESLTGGPGAAPGGELAPGTVGAEAYMEIVMQLALEGYVEGGITSALSAGFLDKFTELDDILSAVLGLGRMSRRVMGPLMNARVITPFQWHVNKQYRPELLSPSDAIRQFRRQNWTFERMEEELARQGWSRERIDALIEGQRKFFSPSDVRQFVTRNHWSEDLALQHLIDQGYTEEEARDALRLEGLRRFEQHEAQHANAIVSAYANRDIDDREFDDLMRLMVQNVTERNLYTELAGVRRRLNTKQLSSAEERRLAIAGIRAAIDYRRALEREGYIPEAVAALDLELRAILADRRADAELRAQQQAERAAEEARDRVEREARLAAIAAQRALPSVAEIRRAYVRGLLPLDRYRAAVEAAHPGIAGEDVAALVADAEADRARQLETEERRQRAESDEAGAALPLAALERAVVRGQLSIEDYARDLRERRYDDREIGILTGLLRAEIEDRQAATQRRAEAERRAAAGGVSLNAWERAVRLGLRTIDQYAAYLASIDTPELARALILDLLRRQVADDEAARAKRAAAEAEAATRGISLDRRRRAVILGLRDLAYYEQALADARLPIDDQRLEIELVAVEAAEAAAARARRDEIAAELDARQAREEAERAAREAAGQAGAPPVSLSLSQVERAVKLGLLVPADLRAFALDKGYAPADAELLVALATFGIPDLREGERRREEIRQELAAKRIALSDLESAVLRGIRTVAEFEAELAARGYGEDDTALLGQLLAERLAVDLDGLRKKIGAAIGKAPDAPTLEALTAALIEGVLEPADALGILEAAGVARDTALVFVRLVLTRGAEG